MRTDLAYELHKDAVLSGWIDEPTQAMGVLMDRNPWEDNLKETLRTLDAFDKRLDPMKTWHPEVYAERTNLVWLAFDIARELDMTVHVAPSPDTPDGILVSILLPLHDDYYPVTWLIPAGKTFNLTKEMRTYRITEYTKDLP